MESIELSEPILESEHSEFLFSLYAGTRLNELEPFGWDAAQIDSFLRFQYEARRRHRAMATPKAEHRLVLYDAMPIGEMLVNRTESEVLLVDIALLPDYRRRRFGTRLIADLISEAKESGRPVSLHVEKTNPAFGLYQRLGFRTIQDTGTHFKMEWRDASESR